MRVERKIADLKSQIEETTNPIIIEALEKMVASKNRLLRNNKNLSKEDLDRINLKRQEKRDEIIETLSDEEKLYNNKRLNRLINKKLRENRISKKNLLISDEDREKSLELRESIKLAKTAKIDEIFETLSEEQKRLPRPKLNRLINLKIREEKLLQ